MLRTKAKKLKKLRIAVSLCREAKRIISRLRTETGKLKGVYIMKKNTKKKIKVSNVARTTSL